MAIRPYKSFLSLLIPGILFCAVAWTYFQPAFRIQISGIPASQWNAHQLARSFYRNALQPNKEFPIQIELRTSFFDFLKKLFPKKKHEPNVRAYAGLVLGTLIPVAFLLAYLSILAGTALSWIPGLKKKNIFFCGAFFLSVYAWGGIWFLHEKAGDLMRTSLHEASRGFFGFIAKSFVQQIRIEPGIALISLPILAALLWFISSIRKL